MGRWIISLVWRKRPRSMNDRSLVDRPFSYCIFSGKCVYLGVVEETRSVSRATGEKNGSVLALPKRNLLEAVSAPLQTARRVFRPLFDPSTIEQAQGLIHEAPQRYFRKVEYPTFLICSSRLCIGPSLARFRTGTGECHCWRRREKVRIGNGFDTTRPQRYLCPQITAKLLASPGETSLERQSSARRRKSQDRDIPLSVHTRPVQPLLSTSNSVARFVFVDIPLFSLEPSSQANACLLEV